jgi:hypothetical protein
MEPEPRTRAFKPRAALFAFAVSLAVLLLWLAGEQQIDHLAPPQELTDNFERMALRSGGLRTWETPLRIALIGKGSAQYGSQVAEAAARFMMLSGIDAQLAPDGAESFNVRIELVPESEYGLVAGRLGARNEGADYLAQHTVCYTVTQIQGVRARHATVVIPDDLPSYEVEACIWHELMHVFGFQSHPRGIESALLAERRLTRNDMVLLRTLYDPRLSRGPRDEMMHRARQIIAEHHQTVERSRDPITALSQR